MRIASILASLLLLASATACAAEPEQLRGFARSELTLERQEGRDSFRVWLALTPEEQQQGLMWVRELQRDQGMLFLLEATRPMDMWMKNTFLSLDMLFFDATGRITLIVPRTRTQSEALISSGGPVAGVLEILAGEAERRGIRTGDRLLLPGRSGR
jgi:hypothetical protein